MQCTDPVEIIHFGTPPIPDHPILNLNSLVTNLLKKVFVDD